MIVFSDNIEQFLIDELDATFPISAVAHPDRLCQTIVDDVDDVRFWMAWIEFKNLLGYPCPTIGKR